MSEGADSMTGSLVSLLKTSASEVKALDVLSRADCLAAAVYYVMSASIIDFKIEVSQLLGKKDKTSVPYQCTSISSIDAI